MQFSTLFSSHCTLIPTTLHSVLNLFGAGVNLIQWMMELQKQRWSAGIATYVLGSMEGKHEVPQLPPTISRKLGICNLITLHKLLCY